MFDFERPNIEVVEISDDKKYGKEVMVLHLVTLSEELCFLPCPVRL